MTAQSTTPSNHLNTRVSHRSGDTCERCPGQGVAQAAAVAAAVLNARMALYDVLRAALGGRPPEAVLLGGLLLAAAAGCAPIVARQFPGAAGARRALALGASAGALMLLLRPPLPAQVLTQRAWVRGKGCRVCCGRTWWGIRQIACTGVPSQGSAVRLSTHAANGSWPDARAGSFFCLHV